MDDGREKVDGVLRRFGRLLMKDKSGSSKVMYLEGLRGLAALIVFFHHFVLAFYPALHTGSYTDAHNSSEVFLSNTPLRLLFSGSLPISLFFCLSGFVLSYKFFRTRDTGSVVSSAARRYIRLVLPILAASTVYYVLLKLQLFHNGPVAHITRSFWLRKYFPFTPDIYVMLKESLFDVFYRNARSYNPVLWTMQYEFYGSFLVYGFLVVFGKLRLRYAVYPVLVAVFINTYYLGFVLGLLLSDLSADNMLERFRNKARINYTVLIAGLALGLYKTPKAGVDSLYSYITFDIAGMKYGIFYTAVGAALVLFALINSSAMQRFFSNTAMDFLGKLSFSLYLLHLSVIYTFSCFAFRLLYGRIAYNAAVLAVFPPSLLLVVVISYIMYKYVDVNSIRLGKYLWGAASGLVKKALPRAG